MQNIESWEPSKYVMRNGKLQASKNKRDAQITSRFTINISAKFFQQYISSYAKGDLLDLGCGKVPLYQMYKPFVNAVTCVDWKDSYHNNKHIDIFADLNQSLPLESDRFDTIIFSSVLEHLRDPNHIFSEMHRILKVDGILFLSVPFFYRLHETPHDYYRFTKYALEMLAGEHNFEMELLESYGGLPEVLADLLSRTYAKIPVFGKWVTIFNQFIFTVFLKTSFGKCFSEKTSHEFPLAYFIILKKRN